ncbi:hypothetical protein APHAL10511_001427 [Amanita phalloides]|nr:hypothetical protein APHAL10511_001427 [Amanita phalloides]
MNTYGIKTKPDRDVYQQFRDKESKEIAVWSVPDKVVEPINPDKTRLMPTIIKRVDLSTVMKQVFNELKIFSACHMLYGWYLLEKRESGKGKVYVYIQIPKPGDLAFESTLTDARKDELREIAVKKLREKQIAVDPEHNKNQYFGFWPHPALSDPSATPYMLRYAELLKSE